MRQRCEYCDSWIDDTDEVCPHCGAPNAHLMASADGVPKTIEELKAFCASHNLPLRDMRFFLGEDYKKPRAFGIYQDGEDFVVYKNKADGSRAVRYRGKDEAYAVNEIYQKMKSEIANQRNFQANKKLNAAKKSNVRRAVSSIIGTVAGVLLSAGLVFAIAIVMSGPSRGYYNYNNTSYYYQDDSWYYYDTSYDTWYPDDDPPEPLTQNTDEYYEGSSYDSTWDASDFSNSSYYKEESKSSSDDDDDWDDNDWNWDSSDSWDSSSTDWNSDW